MKKTTIQTLIELTSEFYAHEAQSFSDSRKQPWDGWHEAIDYLRAHALPPFGTRTGCNAGGGYGADSDADAGADAGADATTGAAGKTTTQPFCCIDVACGNLRFLHFLCAYMQTATPTKNASHNTPAPQSNTFLYIGIDKQPELTARGIAAMGDVAMRDAEKQTAPTQAVPHITLYTHDILSCALEGTPALPCLTHQADMLVCFGFMHHIPSAALRAHVLAELCAQIKPGGVMILSFWCFAQSAQGAAKAARETMHAFEALTARAESGAEGSVKGSAKGDVEGGVKGSAANKPLLNAEDFEPNDFMLGWKHTQGVMRYAHSFTEAEALQLIAGVSQLSYCTHWYADGKDNRSNLYVIAQKTA